MMTLEQLYAAIRSDVTMSELDRLLLIEEVKRRAGNASGRTPIQKLLTMAGGGLIANLIAKYFGMGMLGRTASTLAGIGIGPRLAKGFGF